MPVRMFLGEPEARRDDADELSSLRPTSAPRGERRELETKRAMRTLDAEQELMAAETRANWRRKLACVGDERFLF